MSEKNKIFVVGSYIVALVMDTDRIPVVGETKVGRNYRKAFGGKGSNQAVQASRLGAEVSMLTKIGNDQDGRDFVSLLESEKMDKRFVFIDEKAPTATGFIICSEDGHNVITIDLAALNLIKKEEIDSMVKEIKSGDILLMQFETDVDMVFYAASEAKKKGAIVVMNPAPAVNIAGMDLSSVDYLTPNETEARLCLGLAADADVKEEELAVRLGNLGCKNVVITLGSEGALHYDGQAVKRYGTYDIRPVDSTGAGDAFNAGLTVALLENKSIDEAIMFANAVGARACTISDTIPSYGQRPEIERFIIETPLKR